MDLQHEHRLSPWKAESGPIHSGVFNFRLSHCIQAVTNMTKPITKQ